MLLDKATGANSIVQDKYCLLYTSSSKSERNEMAVTKLWSVTERLGQVIDYATNPEKTAANIIREFSPEQDQALADVIAYAKDEEKTEREFYVEGINCLSLIHI